MYYCSFGLTVGLHFPDTFQINYWTQYMNIIFFFLLKARDVLTTKIGQEILALNDWFIDNPSFIESFICSI